MDGEVDLGVWRLKSPDTSADWVIDLGPEADDGGGNLVYAGIPSGLKKVKESYTRKYV